MSNPPLPPYQYIDTPASWAACLADLRRTDRLAIDIESNSMYVLHEQICLLQISTPDQDYIIDPLLDLDLEALGEIFADSEVEKIFHAAEYDLILIGKQYDWTLNNLFDTMWAARILGYERVGLANMLDELFGFTLDKRYQRANWGERPLSADQLRYAQMDTHFLFQLRDYLAAEITAQDRWVETKETFQQQAQVQMPDDTFDPHRFWSINGVKTLPPRMRAIGFALFTFRYEMAEQLNRPLYKLFGDKVLLQLAEEAPTHLSQLHQTKGLSKWFIRRYGRQLLERIDQAQKGPIPKRPRQERRPSQALLERYDTLQQWRKHRARGRGVESDVILSKVALWAIAEANPHSEQELENLSDLIGAWRTKTYGPEILTLLNGG